MIKTLKLAAVEQETSVSQLVEVAVAAWLARPGDERDTSPDLTPRGPVERGPDVSG